MHFNGLAAPGCGAILLLGENPTARQSRPASRLPCRHFEDRADTLANDIIALADRPAAAFFVRAAGESMRRAGIFDGDLLVIDRGITPQPDDIVIAIVHGELTVKRLQRAWFLAAENPNFPTLPIRGDRAVRWADDRAGPNQCPLRPR